jgi:hypothetical protein
MDGPVMGHLVGNRSNADCVEAPPSTRTWVVALAALVLLLAIVLLSFLPLSSAVPDERVMCDDCHEEFVPFQYTIQAPSEVPVDEPFDLSVTIFNEEMHAVYNPAAELYIEDPDGLVLEMEGPMIQVFDEQGVLPLRSQASYTVPVRQGAIEVRIQLDGSGGFLDDIDLAVQGPDGGQWSANGPSLDEQLSLFPEDFAQGGYGDYVVTVSHPAGIRRASFTLDSEVEYGSSSAILFGDDDLQQDGNYTFIFTLRGTVKAPNQVRIVVSGTCVHSHANGDYDEKDFTREELVPIKVGNKFVYGTPTGSDDGGSPGGFLAGGRYLGFVAAGLLGVSIATSGRIFLAGGRYLGFVAAGLLGVSIATSGRIRQLPRREKVHCWTSYTLAGTFTVHWIMLWAGPYGSTMGGFATGSVMLLIIGLLTLTGVRPELLDERILGMPWRKLHRYVTYALVVILVIHAVDNGTDLAFIREAFSV